LARDKRLELLLLFPLTCLLSEGSEVLVVFIVVVVPERLFNLGQVNTALFCELFSTDFVIFFIIVVLKVHLRDRSVLRRLFSQFIDILGLASLSRSHSSRTHGFITSSLVLLALSEFFFLSFTTLSQIVDTLHDVTDSLLLLRQLSLDTVKVAHQLVEFLILGLFFWLVVDGVEQSEFLLKFFLGSRLVFLGPVEGDEVTQLGLLLALSNLNDDPHHHVL